MTNQAGRLSARGISAAVGLFFVLSGLAYADLNFSTGFDYSSGKYGTAEKTEISYIPFALKYEAETYFVKLTVPHVSITAPSGGDIVAIGPDGQPIRSGGGGRATNKGMGDIVAVAGHTVLQTRAGGVLDVVGKIKFATADENKGLGTGENDYSLQLDWAQKVDAITWFATAGYRFYGDPPGTDFHNAFFGSIGGLHKFAPATSGGLSYDFRQNIVPNADWQSDVTAFVSHKMGKSSKVQLYTSVGLSDASPDWGIGFIATFMF